MALNPFIINKTTSKSTSIFRDFLRFLCAKRPFFDPKPPQAAVFSSPANSASSAAFA